MPYKEFCVFFSGKLFYKSNRKHFSCVCIAWYKHSRRWENSRHLCKPSPSSRVCLTVSNSPNPSRVYIRLCEHGQRFLLHKSWLRTITHTREPMTLVMDSWQTSIPTGFGNSVDLRKSYGGRFLNGFLKRVFYGIQSVARGDCSF